MIKNFDELKKQLAELVEVVNGFKSEQVQLRVVEAILAGMGASDPKENDEVEDADGEDRQLRSRRRSKKAKAKNGDDGDASSGNRKSSGTKKTPKAAILALATDGFFKEHRQIGAVVSHLSEKKAITLSQTTVQVTLNRLVQNGEMQRGKNAENQFEYWR